MTKTRADTGTMPPPPAEDLARTPPSVLAFLEKLEDLVIKLSARIEELESRLNNDSSNSNKPPSSDLPYKKPEQKKKKGTRKGRAGVRQKMLDPHETVDCFPSQCKCGCTEFDDISVYHCHQHIEIPKPELYITHFMLHEGFCSNCETQNKAPVPYAYRFGFGSYQPVEKLKFSGCSKSVRYKEAYKNALTEHRKRCFPIMRLYEMLHTR